MQVLVLVGYPGSGKSFLAKQIEQKSQYAYCTVCRDILGSWQNCASDAKRFLQVCICNYIVDDNTSNWNSPLFRKEVLAYCTTLARYRQSDIEFVPSFCSVSLVSTPSGLIKHCVLNATLHGI